MNNDDIIRLAIEHTINGLKFNEDGLLRFAKLIAEHERKECEKIIWNADAWIGNDAKIWIVKSIQEARGQA